MSCSRAARTSLSENRRRRSDGANAARRSSKLNEELAGEALRTLGVAFRSLPKDAFRSEEIDERVEHELVFLGLIGMIDPPRDEAKERSARAKGAGIRPIMITGDHPMTAAVIAAELGIASDGRAVTGAELEKDVGRGARPDGSRRVGLRARQSRAQAADREGAAAQAARSSR